MDVPERRPSTPAAKEHCDTGRPSAVITPSDGAPTGTGVRIALLSTSDTDLLSARSSHAAYALADPSKLDVDTELAGVVEGADVVIVRILGTARSWQQGLDLLIASKVPLLVLGGEQTPDAELMRLSTVPMPSPVRRTATWPKAGRRTWRSCMPSSATRCC